MNTNEACAYLGISDRTLGRLVRRGQLPAVKAGPGVTAAYHFSPEDVKHFLGRQKVWPPRAGGEPAPLRERMLSRLIIDPSGCLLWTGARNSSGYGHIRVGGGRSDAFVHRLMYEMFAEPIPDGLELDHLCRVRHCASPAHLEPVTSGQNKLRAWAFRLSPHSDARTREMGRLRSARYRARKKAAAR
jgi:excisionase family DNA binding protein